MRCGNDPRIRWTGGDRKTVAVFKAWLEEQRHKEDDQSAERRAKDDQEQES